MTIDPSATAEELAELAQSDPAAWDAILQHPSCYDELASWIADMRQLTTDPEAVTSGSVEKPVSAPSGVAQPFGIAVVLGIAIGVVAGGAVSAALILVVLPGLFGGGLG